MPAVQRPQSTRSVAATSQHAAFTFPVAQHLIITTPEHVHAIDSAGSRNIFRSASKGILAARETKDGRTLAVSDSHNVVLHCIENGLEKSYRLKGSGVCSKNTSISKATLISSTRAGCDVLNLLQTLRPCFLPPHY